MRDVSVLFQSAITGKPVAHIGAGLRGRGGEGHEVLVGGPDLEVGGVRIAAVVVQALHLVQIAHGQGDEHTVNAVRRGAAHVCESLAGQLRDEIERVARRIGKAHAGLLGRAGSGAENSAGAIQASYANPQRNNYIH